MQSDADEVPAWRVAFDALLPLADLARQAAVLRTALRALVDDSGRALAFHFAPRGPRPRRSGDGQWAELRTRVRDKMAKQRVSSTALAGVIGIMHSTLQRIISPSSPRPARRWVAALQAWGRRQHPRHPCGGRRHAGDVVARADAGAARCTRPVAGDL